MKYRFFYIPAQGSESFQDELNTFCSTQRIIAIDRQFVTDAEHSYWAFCITYQEQDSTAAFTPKGKIDYKEVLSAEDRS
ncbi:MAG: hypothetical protein GY731_15620 [Gammaproteobacteria bacterium]|nr:hypothetical protein [Gammaproteobacteria bacterium]